VIVLQSQGKETIESYCDRGIRSATPAGAHATAPYRMPLHVTPAIFRTGTARQRRLAHARSTRLVAVSTMLASGSAIRDCHLFSPQARRLRITMSVALHRARLASRCWSGSQGRASTRRVPIKAFQLTSCVLASFSKLLGTIPVSTPKLKMRVRKSNWGSLCIRPTLAKIEVIANIIQHVIRLHPDVVVFGFKRESVDWLNRCQVQRTESAR
jgi:hypothetical protein